MRVLLDTNAYSAFRLLFGFRNGSRYEENTQELRAFLDDPNVTLLPIALSTADRFGQISAALRKQGRPIPTNDIWLAAQAMEADAALLSSDKHFAQVDGLTCITFPAG